MTKYAGGENRQALETIADAFARAWTDGEWDGYLALYADDFVFEYPAEPSAGRWTGADAVAHRDRWHQRFKDVRVVTTGEDLRMFAGPWVAVCNHSESVIAGTRRKNVLTTVLHRIDGSGRIVEYREFLGARPE
ncbi:nuclear transport factor 2 family protein [Amycolatopsis sp. CA-161197]|uniref:nuclear transport factor 2 family protein n=1 Tax=Amycolatopsis sp. CA-161197 TaxID=3239922 RepID=UPI003D949A6B